MAVSLHLHHSLEKTCSTGILLSLKKFPIRFACSIPVEFKFLWVEQSLMSKFSGSPPPGAKACLIKTNFLPSCRDVIISELAEDPWLNKQRKITSKEW